MDVVCCGSFDLPVLMAVLHMHAIAVCADCHRNSAGWQSSFGTDCRRSWECFTVGM